MRFRSLLALFLLGLLVSCAAVLGLPDPELDNGVGASSSSGSGGVDVPDGGPIGDGGAAFGLQVASEITVRIGDTASLDVTLDRPSAASGTSLTVTGLAAGVSAPPVTIPGGQTRGEIVISAASTALAGSTKARLSATEGATVVGGADVLVTVLPGGAGVPDPSFGDGGLIVQDIGFTASRIAYGADAKLVVVGQDPNSAKARRYLPDGSLDTTYGTAGLVTLTGIPTTAVLQALTVLPNGKAVVGYNDGSASAGVFMMLVGADGVPVQPPRPIPVLNSPKHDVTGIFFDAPSNFVFATVDNFDDNLNVHGGSVAKFDENLNQLAFSGAPGAIMLGTLNNTGLPMGAARPAPLPDTKIFVALGKRLNPDQVKISQFDTATGDPVVNAQILPFGAPAVVSQMSTTDGGAFITGGVLLDGGVELGVTRVTLTAVDPKFGGLGGARAGMDGGLVGVRLLEMSGGIVVSGCGAFAANGTLVRFDTAGVQDKTFGDGGFTTPVPGQCWGALQRDAQGRILAVSANSTSRMVFARYTP